MIKCKAASKLISKDVDKRLQRTERLSLRFHLLFCTPCCNFKQQISFLRKALHRLRQSEVDDSKITLSAEAKSRIKNSVEQAKD